MQAKLSANEKLTLVRFISITNIHWLHLIEFGVRIQNYNSLVSSHEKLIVVETPEPNIWIFQWVLGSRTEKSAEKVAFLWFLYYSCYRRNNKRFLCSKGSFSISTLWDSPDLTESQPWTLIKKDLRLLEPLKNEDHQTNKGYILLLTWS